VKVRNLKTIIGHNPLLQTKYKLLQDLQLSMIVVKGEGCNNPFSPTIICHVTMKAAREGYRHTFNERLILVRTAWGRGPYTRFSGLLGTSGSNLSSTSSSSTIKGDLHQIRSTTVIDSAPLNLFNKVHVNMINGLHNISISTKQESSTHCSVLLSIHVANTFLFLCLWLLH